jgi:putative ABC transport system substrate-binding protein
MRRRAFVAGIAAVVAAPLGAASQQSGKAFRVVVLGIGVNARSAPFFVGFERRLRDLGYIEGQNLLLDYRYPQAGLSLEDIARQIVRERVDVIVATGPEPPLKAAWKATRRVPIVMVAMNYDPVRRGYVASLARPGGNVTGVSYQQVDLSSKQLEFLLTAVPGSGRVGVLWEPFIADQVEAVQEAARSLRVDVLTVEVPPPYDYDRAFSMLRGGRVRGVVVLGSPVFFRDQARIQQLALREGLATVGTRGYAKAGALLAYGPDLVSIFERGADYVDRVLRGERPAEMPVEQPTKFELVVNLQTAKALGLTIPQALLLRADEVVQ